MFIRMHGGEAWIAAHQCVLELPEQALHRAWPFTQEEECIELKFQGRTIYVYRGQASEWLYPPQKGLCHV